MTNCGPMKWPPTLNIRRVVIIVGLMTSMDQSPVAPAAINTNLRCVINVDHTGLIIVLNGPMMPQEKRYLFAMSVTYAAIATNSSATESQKKTGYRMLLYVMIVVQ